MHIELGGKYDEAYTALSSERVIFLADDITKELASSLCGLLIYYNALNPNEDIHIFINTNGGDALALSSIYDVMGLIDAPISTIGVGKIYSAGAFILAAGTKGKRFMFPNAEVMIHGLQCSFPEMPMSDQTDSVIYYNYLENLNKRLLKILAKHSGQPISKISQDSKRDLYLDAKAAVKYGIIDKVL
jgi:ATP-dependent Clp protease, protease subunit